MPIASGFVDPKLFLVKDLLMH